MVAPAAYLDECVDHDLVDGLRLRRFTVTSAREQGQANRGATDEDQLVFATARDFVLVTFNERHFRALAEGRRRRGVAHGGIVVLSARPPFERLIVRAAMMLEWLGTMPDHRSQIFKWGRLQELLEQGYRLPSFTDEEVSLALAR
jgi:hypothetical protein